MAAALFEIAAALLGALFLLIFFVLVFCFFQYIALFASADLCHNCARRFYFIKKIYNLYASIIHRHMIF
jgi:hypothetical protein